MGNQASKGLWTMALSLPCWALAGPVLDTATNREWRQLTETVNVSITAMRAVCDATTGACSGSVGGFSVEGWTFAADADVKALYQNFGLPAMDFAGGTSYTYLQADGFYGTKVDDFVDIDGVGSDAGLFNVTYNFPGQQTVSGYTRTINPRAPSPYAAVAIVGLLETDRPNSIVTLSSSNNGAASTFNGFWMYRTAPEVVVTPLPLPNSLALTGLALVAGAGVWRRTPAKRRQGA